FCRFSRHGLSLHFAYSAAEVDALFAQARRLDGTLQRSNGLLASSHRGLAFVGLRSASRRQWRAEHNCFSFGGCFCHLDSRTFCHIEYTCAKEKSYIFSDPSNLPLCLPNFSDTSS